MADLFLYGTLRFAPLLQTVLGRDHGDLTLFPATLPDHAVHRVGGQPYPMILPRPGAAAQGVLVRGLTGGDIDRLEFYEGGFDYDLRPATLRLDAGGTATAQVFFASQTADKAAAPGAPWNLQDWAERWGAQALVAATEVMAWHGRMSAAAIAARFPAIRRRAWARLSAQARPSDPQRDPTGDVRVLAHSRAYLGFYAMDETDLQFRRHDGAMSRPVNRAALLVGEAAVVLPYDPVRDCVLLVQQFRAPVFIAGDPAPWVWEPVAGLVDPGETPIETAHREAMEEAGLVLRRLEPAGRAYSSPGSSGEFLHLFVGIADLGSVADGGGVAAEGEDIRTRRLSFDDLMQEVDEHRLNTLPLVMLVLWLARHHDRLRDNA